MPDLSTGQSWKGLLKRYQACEGGLVHFKSSNVVFLFYIHIALFAVLDLTRFATYIFSFGFLGKWWPSLFQVMAFLFRFTALICVLLIGNSVLFEKCREMASNDVTDLLYAFSAGIIVLMNQLQMAEMVGCSIGSS